MTIAAHFILSSFRVILIDRLLNQYNNNDDNDNNDNNNIFIYLFI